MIRTCIGKVLSQTVKTSRQIVLGLHSQRYFSSHLHWTKEELDKIVKKDKIVVFMKGTPDEPMCGFSRAVMQILQRHGVHEFITYNILEDEGLRTKIKDYSNWPTIPQVYMNGEFIGGCDIMIQMHQSGDLITELENIGIQSALLDQMEK